MGSRVRGWWLGQAVTVLGMTDYAASPVFIIQAAPGEAFPDGSIMFTASKSEFTAAAIVEDDAFKAWIDSIRDAERLECLSEQMEETQMRMGLL